MRRVSELAEHCSAQRLDIDWASPDALLWSRRPIDSSPGGGQSFATMVNAVVFPGGGVPPQSRIHISVNDGAPVLVDLQAGGNFGGNQAAIAGQIQTRIQNFLPTGTAVTVSWQTVHDAFRARHSSSAAPSAGIERPTADSGLRSL